jgi:hypothetical protein
MEEVSDLFQEESADAWRIPQPHRPQGGLRWCPMTNAGVGAGSMAPS